jgi:hypothetical protein
MPERKKIRKLSPLMALIVAVSLLLQMSVPVLAASKTKLKSPGITVSASVGEFYLSVSGYIAPFASLVLTSDGVFYRSTVADKFGNFSLTDIEIKAGFSKFCILAKDFHNLGESYTCFSFPPATGDIIMKDIFLPPTLALERSEITSGSNAKA